MQRANPCVPCLLAGNPGFLEDPGEVTWIAKLLRLVHPLPDGRRFEHSWEQHDAPDCFWSEEHQSLYAFPGLDVAMGTCDVPRNRQTYETWTAEHPDGPRSPSWCGRLQNLPRRIAIRACGRTEKGEDEILYLSDKWDPFWVRYIHPFESGNRVYLGPGSPPAVIIVEGPPLRLGRWGLEG